MEELNKIINFKLIQTSTGHLDVKHLLLLLLVLIFTAFGLRIYRKYITKHLPIADQQKIISLFNFLKYFIYFIVILFTAHSSGVNLGLFATYAAAIFVGLGLALQTFLQDIASGITIILDQSLHVGDVIEVDGKVGKVTNIRIRSTIMVTRNDRVMVIPNHKFMNDPLLNWTQNEYSNRENVTLGVGYSSDVQLVKKLLIECASNAEGVLLDKPIEVYFEDFGDSSLIFSVYFYIKDGLYSNTTQSDIRFKIDKVFKENAIEIPFPQRVVNILNK